VDSLDPEEMRAHRGTLTEPGRESPDRGRSAHENLELFRRMRAGEFLDGALTLRARIDMASPNMNLRDPVIYRIQRHHHYRTGDTWCIYPMYDYAHPLSDAIEGVTHSICTLEFEDHRPLYDWFLEQLADLLPARPRQIEFARLNLSYTLMSKRRLLELVREKHVAGWDDPRMPTLVGLRRRGFPPAAIRAFCERIGVGKSDSWIDMSVLEDCVREELNAGAPRALAVFNPLKVVLTDYPEEREEFFEAPNHPQQPEAGTRQVPFGRELYIDRDDFMEDPPKKFFRLAPGREVRLRFGYIIRCDEVIRDSATGEVLELRCSHDPTTRGANPADGRKVKGTIHWVSARHAASAQVRIYDRLFAVPTPGSSRAERDWRQDLNPHSLEVRQVLVEPGLMQAPAGFHVQFERIGYFFSDPLDSRPGQPVFNRVVGLRDSWAKVEGGG
jgi:glutaminyl-tRNA synthetase